MALIVKIIHCHNLSRLAFLIFCLQLSVLATENSSNTARPQTWATPLIVTGVPNLHQISATLYRSAQPTAEG